MTGSVLDSGEKVFRCAVRGSRVSNLRLPNPGGNDVGIE